MESIQAWVLQYVGISGIGKNSASDPRWAPNAGLFGYEPSVPHVGETAGLGISIKDVQDGMSNTLAFMETATNNGPWHAGGPTSVRGLDPNGGPYIGLRAQFSSGHRISNFGLKQKSASYGVLLDASVCRISEDISPRIFEALATIAGGEEVTAREYVLVEN